MSSPAVEHGEMLKRLEMYLADKTRVQVEFKYQCEVKEVVVFADTDFAGCAKTRKSTSGGVIMYGSHFLNSWSTSQIVVVLSSGEAEYYDLLKEAAQTIGFKKMVEELGVNIGVKLKTDASAATLK